MSPSSPIANPFPGLRPFEAEEDHLFFGREQHVDELVRRLRSHRFLAVVGTSGCGKSSLIRCGLVPSLHGGQMVSAGSSWRIAIFRPGDDPFGELAAAIASPEVLDEPSQTRAVGGAAMVDATLRRGPRGLTDVIQLARLPPRENVLVIVDQFEELFRFQRSRQVADARGEAVAFVKLLLEASQQTDTPIYVVLTMRSDFIGECIQYPGLPEALNAGQYLVPRMTRDELRSAIAGPVAVAGAEITPRIVQRLLNEVGSDQDQLPVLQHALMRTWDRWSARPEPRGPVDLADYEAVGGMREALSRHAEEAFVEAGAGFGQHVAEQVFRALTDLVTDPRGIRRPCSVAELCAVAAAPSADVQRVIELFRRPGRSFLMPPVPAPLEPDTVVDISHESLMRCWTRLRGWAEEERASATVYLRLSRAAQWFADGTAALWGQPELGMGLKWRRDHDPTAAWARRYDDSFDRAMGFLQASEREFDRIIEERRAERRRQWRRLQWVAAMLATLLFATGVTAYLATRESRRARAESARAEQNLQLARQAVDESLAVVQREPALLGVDVPEIVGFRRELLEKAQRFYTEFIAQAPSSEELQRENAIAKLRLGHIDRALDAREAAVDDYRAAIDAFGALVAAHPERDEYQWALADAHNWLGQVLWLLGNRFAEAKAAYGTALEQAARAGATSAEHQQAVARVRYNRGVLLADHVGRDGVVFADAEADLREAVRLLEPLAAGSSSASQDLARVYNNLGRVILDQERPAEAREWYQRAVLIHEALTKQQPGNREYAMELVKFDNNLADVLRELGDTAEATRMNGRALDGIERLARAAPSVGIERADTYNLLGSISQNRSAGAALAPYRRALELFTALGRDDDTRRFPEFHERFGDLLVNLADLRAASPPAGSLADEALDTYLGFADRAAASGSPAEARSVLYTLDRVRQSLTGGAASKLDLAMNRLRPLLESQAAAAPGTPR